MFFESSTLSNGQHTLLITNLGTGVLWIDYILYTPSVPQSVLPSTSSSFPPSTLPTLTSHTVTLTPSRNPIVDTPTPVPSSTSSHPSSGTGLPGQVNSNSKSSVPAPAVVGGAIGALILITVLIFGMLYYRKRAKRLAGAKLLEKKDVLGDPSEFDKGDPGAAITPFTSAYASGPHTSASYGSSNVNVYPPGSAYPSNYGYQNQSQPSTPIYHFSNHYALRSSYSASSDNIAGAGAGYGGVGHGSSQYGGTQHGYANSNGQSDYLQNPHSQYSGGQQHAHTSPDRLAVPQHRGSIESAESHTSLAYLSGNRLAMDSSSPLPDVLPGPLPTQAALQRTGKGGLIVYNDSPSELHQHEDGGVRLDVQQPPGSGSQQHQVIDLPPVYKPHY
ncbi:hypothetical protein BDM02DRAFT_3168361 [Thelephora ganbajun]|uniref:Uncharacterized protein n=1 Tax=Thelephora ganbajun TaxID=370292 RepID=A0ACB6ZH43_THEGA|nr:hypothetical protein BDM02DRAFT_3168361 [Thelephora ganbajun]